MRRRLALGVLLLATALALGLAGASRSASAPPAPTGLTGIAEESAVGLAWQPVTGASSYVVYRGTSASSVTTAVTPAGGVTATSFTDASAVDGTTYFYVVHAVASGVESPDSLVVQVAPVHRACSTGNPIVLENCYPGNTPWNVRNTATIAAGGIEGYATAQSVNAGSPIDIKVNAAAGATFNIEVYRTGYYGGAEARLFSVIQNVPAIAQPACVSDATTGLLSCSNWSVSATISTTSDWTSGIYVLRLVRNDTGTDNQILFVVRNDARSGSDVLYGAGMSTFQAYNNYGGKSLYDFNSSGNNTAAGTPRAVKVSFDRPFEQPRSGLRDWYTRTEIASVAWLEQSGYDTTYIANTDLETNPGLALTHKVYFSPAHDEYVSAAMRTALTQARDSGVSLFFSGGNAVYWKIRFENDPTTGAGGRVEVCYKSTQSGSADPSGIPTGTWRDPNGANLPENQLIGIMYVGDNDQTYFPLVVNATQGSDRVFRYTGLDTQAVGSSTSLGHTLVGWEWDAPVNNGFEPAGVVRLSGSPVNGNLIQANGAYQTAGSTTVTATKYKAPSGALVFATGTNHWNRGLAANADGVADLDTRIQQITVNVLEDMGVTPSTPTSAITLDSSSSTQGTPPTSVSATAQGPDSIQISWAPVAGASGYNVYRTLSARSDGLPLGALANGSLVTGTSFTDISLSSSTTYYYVVTAVTNGAQSAASAETSATTAAAAGSATRIDVGASKSYTSATGAVFQADTFVTGGTLRSVTTSIAGTNDPQLFQTERWGQFTYAIPVANGVYDVRFEFAETYYTGACAGKRVFGMDILNTAASPDLSNIDICAAVGPATAYIRTVTGVSVTNGTLSIKSVYGSVDDPTIQALEVIPESPSAPTVSATTPANGATGVSIQVQPRATFSRSMDPTSINSSTVTLKATSSGTTIPASVTYDGTSNAVTIVPSSALANSTSYTAQVGTGVRSADGVSLAAPYSWAFTTAAPSAPDVTSTSPADGATGVSPNVAVSAVFSRPIDPTTVTASSFTLRSPDGSLVAATVAYDSTAQAAWLTPSAPLALGTTYTARLGTAITSTDGIALAAPYVWSFTTALTPPTPPSVVSTAPAAAASGVAENGSVTATFDRAIDPSTLTAATFTLAGAAGPISGTISYDAASLTAKLVPTATLAPSSTYTASVTTGVRSTDGTPLGATVTWSFTTSSPPTITASAPAAGASFVSRAAPVTVTFSRSMTAASVTPALSLKDGGGTPVPATISYDDTTHTATLQPQSLLQGGATYTAAVDGSATAADGAPTGSGSSWTFTTAACPCSLHSVVSQPAVQNLSVRDGRSGTGPWSYELGVKVTVDEPMDLTSIRFFKSSSETGTHVGRVWTAGGVQLASVTFTSETASGWQSQALSAPLVLQPNTVYIVSVNANAYFSQTSCCSTSGSGLSNAIIAGPLRSVADGKNGVFGSAAGVFPTSSYHSSDYFVDLQVVPDGTPAPPAVTVASPAGGTTNVGLRNAVTATFSRPMDPASITASTFLLTDSTGASVPAAVTYADATSTATLAPSAMLAYDTTYTVRVSGSVRASDGMPMGSDTTWTFHTAAQQSPLAVVSSAPAASATGVQTDTAVQIAFNRDVDTTTLTSTNVQLLGPTGTPVTTSIAYNGATDTATLTPAAALSATTTYTVQVGTGLLASSDGTPAVASSWTFTTGLCPCSLFAPTLTPAVTKASVQDGRTGTGPWSYEMGVKFQVTRPAQLTAIRFYKSPGETGTHVGTLWTATGVKLASVTFSGETASGWQQASLASPVALSANTTYVVSVGLNVYYVSTKSGLATQVTGGIVQSVADGRNGVYGASAGTFPTSSYSSSNYFVDVVIR